MIFLLSKEPYCYKIHTLLMKSIALHPYIDNPFLLTRRFTLWILQWKVGLVYKVLHFKMLILISLVYVLFGFITITATYRKFLGTYIKCKKNIRAVWISLQKFFKLAVSSHLALSTVSPVQLECFREKFKIKLL